MTFINADCDRVSSCFYGADGTCRGCNKGGTLRDQAQQSGKTTRINAAIIVALKAGETVLHIAPDATYEFSAIKLSPAGTCERKN